MSGIPNDLSLFKARLIGIACSGVLAAVIITAWSLFEFDLMLVAYGLATVLSCYVVVTRFCLWAQRPPTMAYYKRCLGHVRRFSFWRQHGPALAKKVVSYFSLNAFVAKRGAGRWAAHWPIMLGCVMAAAIAFPLVFGWVWFQSVPEDLSQYRLMVFGIATIDFHVDSFFAFMLFHGLVWATFPVLIGITVAFIRRLKHRGDLATQNFAEDFVPLIALFIISLSGLMLAASYTWLQGIAYDFIAVIHAAAVILTMLWLPYSKFMHVPQRSLKLAQMVTSLAAENRAYCQRCGEDFASADQIADLKLVEDKLGFSYAKDGLHYQDVCPKCRRANLVLAQGARWRQSGFSVESLELMNKQEQVLSNG